MQFTAIQWNIGSARIRSEGADGAQSSSYNQVNPEYIAETIKALAPDVVTLQEVAPHQGTFLAERIKLTLHAEDHYTSQLGLTIMSRFPATDHEFFYIANPIPSPAMVDGKPWTPRDLGISRCRLTLSENTALDVCNVHLPRFEKVGASLPDSRLDQTRVEIAKHLMPRDVPLLVQGDFNNNAELAPTFPDLMNAGCSEVHFDVPTTPKGRRDDHVIYKQVTHLTSRVIDTLLTDHHLLVLTFEI